MTDQIEHDPPIETGDLEHPEIHVTVSAMLIYDSEGNYFIHGVKGETPDAMFKAMQGLWGFDPVKEIVHHVEIPMTFFKPSFLVKPYVKK